MQVMASFGYVIAAPHACNVGCFGDNGVSTCASLPHDPPCFGNYYKEQLAVFDWARQHQDEPPLTVVDWAGGFGVAGHSMGGQATVFSSSYDNATKYNIKAAVMHHAYSHSFPTPTVPFAVFTGTADTTAPAGTMGQPLFESPGGSAVRAYVNKVGAGHHEPDVTSLDPNGIGLLAQFSAAWLKIYLDETPQAFGLDFHEMIFGSGAGSVCGGGDGQMANCTIMA